MKGDEPRNELIEIAKKLYNDVKVGLETKKTRKFIPFDVCKFVFEFLKFQLAGNYR